MVVMSRCGNNEGVPYSQRRFNEAEVVQPKVSEELKSTFYPSLRLLYTSIYFIA